MEDSEDSKTSEVSRAFFFFSGSEVYGRCGENGETGGVAGDQLWLRYDGYRTGVRYINGYQGLDN